MKATVSYNLRFDKEGTSYNQMVNIKLSQTELDSLNKYVLNDKDNYGDLSLYYNGKLKDGDNYVSLSYRDSIIRFMNDNKVKTDRKILDRNTMFRIKIVKPFHL